MSRLLLLLGLVSGCEGVIIMPRPGVKVPAVRVVAGAPSDAQRPARSKEGTFVAPSALFVEGGAIAVVDQGAVSVRTDAGVYAQLPVGESLGTVRAVARREAGVLLATDTGLFHDAQGQVLRSPLSSDLPGSLVRFLDSVGSGSSEVLWVTSGEGSRIAGGRREAVQVSDPDEPGTLQVVIGRSATSALLVQGASLYSVDVAAKSVSVLARGVGKVAGFDVRADGVVLIATDDGLLEVAVDDAVSRRTFAAEGAKAASVVDVTVAGAAVLVATTTHALELTDSGPQVLTVFTRPKPETLARDANGDTWVVDQDDLIRLATGTPGEPEVVSFAAEVKPFLRDHCRSCHASGANYAPILDLESFSVAKQWAARSLARIKDPLSPMPPSSTEVLTPAQYDVFVRWVDGGLKP